MNYHRISTKIVAGVFSLFLLMPTLIVFAGAVDEKYNPSSNDLWNSLSEFKDSSDLYEYLIENDWINGSLTNDEFDYILVLTDQLCSMYDNVDAPLILAQIAVESRFDIYADSGSARGLMQLIPVYHEERMRQFIEDDYIFTLDDFYNPRLNIVTGIDYMSELLNMTDGDVRYSLMCYNEGPSTATKHYRKDGRTSYYAKEIIKLSVEIERYLTGR